MSTIPGKIRVAYDNQYRMTVQSTTWIGTQTPGTATDMIVSIIAGPDGATAVAGTTTLYVQGSNTTATATSNWTTVVADKGTIAAVTASGTQTLHFAQLQYAYYHLALSNTAASTADVSVVWDFLPVQDSFDATVA
jgi:uncharacterized protein YhfF